MQPELFWHSWVALDEAFKSAPNVIGLEADSLQLVSERQLVLVGKVELDLDGVDQDGLDEDRVGNDTETGGLGCLYGLGCEHVGGFDGLLEFSNKHLFNQAACHFVDLLSLNLIQLLVALSHCVFKDLELQAAKDLVDHWFNLLRNVLAYFKLVHRGDILREETLHSRDKPSLHVNLSRPLELLNPVTHLHHLPYWCGAW